MRLGATKTGATTTYNGLGDQLYDKGGARPTLDLNFASNGSLVDSVTGKTLVTHTRQSNATYVDGDGIIKDAVTNLALYSEDYSSGNWGTASTANLSSENILAPDGTLGVFKVVPGNGLNYQVLRSGGISLPDNAVVTVSCYFKPAEWNSLKIALRDKVGSYKGVIFNYDTQEFSGANSEAIDYGFEQQSNGFIRVWVVIDDTSSGSYTPELTVYPLNDSTLPTTGDGTSGIYVWGAQLEESSTAGEYVKTTSTINSAPRFDHNPTTGESLGLLVEESRANLMPYSVATTTDWDPSGGTTTDLSLNALGVFPGVRCASGGLVYHGVNTGQITGLTNGATYTVTFWFRAGDTDPSNMVRFILRNDTTAAPSTIQKNSRSTAFDSVSSYSASDSSVGTSTSSLTVLSVETMADGLTYKLVASFVYAGSSTDLYKFGIHANSATTGETVIALGMQLEQGSFATSYIPTSGSSATRAADVTSITGTNFSSWYNQTEGTVFVEGSVPVGNTSSRALLSVDDGTNNERIQIRHNGTTARTQLVVNNGSVQFNASLVGGSFPLGEYRKLAMAVKANEFAAVTDDNGTVDTGTGTMPTPTQLQIGNSPSNPQPCKPIKRLTYWPTRLSNDTLETITV